jgi:NADH dehydrogenase [ubiquinone] 1 alpha subcomplex assembly factor 7
MSALKSIIAAQIARFGPISVAEYMTLCLLHPEHGYYTTRDPLGAQGDFTTAPEISQMFGEMLGLALVQSWQDQGAPADFVLVELGPGRGTLMADILRVAAKAPGFLDAAEIWLVEASPKLREIQGTTLSNHSVHWTSQITDIPEKPVFLIANEFFDVLPIRQFARTQSGWQERLIGLDADALVFGRGTTMPVSALEDQNTDEPNIGTAQFVETSAAAQSIVFEINRRIAAIGGTALVIDYGDWGSEANTFQAVAAHKKTDPLANPGQADLTAHVDFAALSRAAPDVAHSKLTNQGALLERLGITARAQALAGRLDGNALENHIAAHRRLTHPDEMGSLFKALAFHPMGAPCPPGFD